MARILVVTSELEDSRRIGAFAERMGFSLLTANSADHAAQIVGAVPLAAILVDTELADVLPQVERVQPRALRVEIAESICAQSDAHRLLKRPVDLHVLEHVLHPLLEPAHPTSSIKAAAPKQPVRVREREV